MACTYWIFRGVYSLWSSGPLQMRLALLDFSRNKDRKYHPHFATKVSWREGKGAQREGGALSIG